VAELVHTRTPTQVRVRQNTARYEATRRQKRASKSIAIALKEASDTRVLQAVHNVENTPDVQAQLASRKHTSTEKRELLQKLMAKKQKVAEASSGGNGRQ
jgi:hypothetical protein